MGGPGRTGRTRRSALSRASAAALASLVLSLALIAAGRPDPAATIADQVVGSPALSNGHVTFTIPGAAAVLLRF
jgi:hypothetical protein